MVTRNSMSTEENEKKKIKGPLLHPQKLLVCTRSKYILALVQFSNSSVSNSLQPHGLKHARLPVHHQLPELARTHVH